MVVFLLEQNIRWVADVKHSFTHPERAESASSYGKKKHLHEDCTLLLILLPAAGNRKDDHDKWHQNSKFAVKISNFILLVKIIHFPVTFSIHSLEGNIWNLRWIRYKMLTVQIAVDVKICLRLCGERKLLCDYDELVKLQLCQRATGGETTAV